MIPISILHICPYVLQEFVDEYKYTFVHRMKLQSCRSIGTVTNGKLYVAITTVTDGSERMLGLFCSNDIKQGDIVTSYGGKCIFILVNFY